MTTIEKFILIASIPSLIILGLTFWNLAFLIRDTLQYKSYCERTTNLCWDLTAIVDKDPNTNTIWEYNRK